MRCILVKNNCGPEWAVLVPGAGCLLSPRAPAAQLGRCEQGHTDVNLSPNSSLSAAKSNTRKFHTEGCMHGPDAALSGGALCFVHDKIFSPLCSAEGMACFPSPTLALGAHRGEAVQSCESCPLIFFYSKYEIGENCFSKIPHRCLDLSSWPLVVGFDMLADTGLLFLSSFFSAS